MRLTTYTDDTRRVLIKLAASPRDLTTIAEIADSYDISENHLTKVAHRLGVADYIETMRGRNGGIRLLKKPDDINIGDAVRRMEQDFDPVPCFNTSDSCVIELVCALKEAIGETRDAFLAALVSYTVAGLVAPKRKLTVLLAMPRVTLRHTGRNLTANRATVAVFILINLAAVKRVCASWRPDFMMIRLALAAACWVAAFALVEIVYGPLLLTRQPTSTGSSP
jgi:Rrf2 family nitric oxide-sensitive transcriptional repressor